MDTVALLTGLSNLLDPQLIVFMFTGVAIGLLFGAIPGLTGSMAIAMILPLTFTMPPLPTLVLLLSIYTGGISGGALTAILINTPGSPSSVATSLDGYPMTQKGQASRALGISIMASTVGGALGIIVLIAALEPLANVALKFGPSEMFMVAVFALTMIASINSENPFKGLFVGMFGILLGTTGMTATGVTRGTFGSPYLLDGIPLVPSLVGLFCISELFVLMQKEFISDIQDKSYKNSKMMFKGMFEVFKSIGNVIRSSIIGVFIGALPAAGSSVANLMAYTVTQRLSKHPEKFGTGHHEGLVSAETANNASEGGSIATMLALGIPGSTATAVLLGALIMKGWLPGPRLIYDHKDVIYSVLASLVVQEFVLLIVGTVFFLYLARLATVPTRVLVPSIFVFTVIGAFAVRKLLFDAVLMFVFGIIGYFLRKTGYPIMPIVLGILLGKIADAELIRTSQMFAGDYSVFFTRPISLILVIASILSFLYPFVQDWMRKKKDANKQIIDS